MTARVGALGRLRSRTAPLDVLDVAEVAFGRDESFASFAMREGVLHRPVDASSLKFHQYPSREVEWPYRSPGQRHENAVAFLDSIVAWGQQGAPSFELTHDFYKAAAVTDFAGEDAMPQLPFPQMLIVLPTEEDDIFVCSDGTLVCIRAATAARTATARAPQGASLDALLAGARFHNLDPSLPTSQIDELTAGLQASTRTLFNVLRYLESASLPTTKHVHGAPAQPVERIHKDRPVYRVGRPVVLDRKIREALASTSPSKQTWHVAQRFIVRGHWRSQPCGERLAERRRIWVKPFWKGPKDVAQALQRTYVVQ